MTTKHNTPATGKTDPIVPAPTQPLEVGVTHAPAIQDPAPTQGPAAAEASGSPDPAMPPAQGAPARPRGFTPLSRPQIKTMPKIMASQEATIGLILAEIRALATSGRYVQVFSPRMPAAALLGVLERAAAWSAENHAATNWGQYVHDQRLTAWDNARPLLAAFQQEFTAAVADDATLAGALPGTASFLGVRSTVSKRGVATRKASGVVSTAKVQRAAASAQKKADKVAQKAAAAQHAADVAKLAATEHAAAGQPASAAAGPAAGAGAAQPGGR